MAWMKRMNDALGYIEENLAGRIDHAQAAKIACCSVHHFQRMFSFIAGVPLSEYIRRRRLTLSAFELQTTGGKVLDIALKYGYDSPEAFARAFHALHGVAPTAARNSGVPLQAYPRMAFSLTVKGEVGMKYRIEQTEAFSVVGFKERVPMKDAFQVIPRLWEQAKEKGQMDQLIELLWSEPTRMPRGILGICADGNFGTNDEFDYYLASLSDREPAEGMEKLNFPKSTWAVFEITPDLDVQGIWQRLYTEWIPTSEYELANVPGIECYCPPGHHPQAEVWIAVEKKQGR
ncbi:AraC family transcriptional regulator [Brevibacillus brevis]|uniref:AraC family transcriptional regulator n=1 Tax=Brevibacillus brevis TaxID=1393 RepID=A0ABY9T3Q7_BREBE|nr:AraC family transcriptional regulator [Brevibacillus brevis]WNC13866.1 AraC family transcriptional regulator [Brevibacillus brevis]